MITGFSHFYPFRSDLSKKIRESRPQNLKTIFTLVLLLAFTLTNQHLLHAQNSIDTTVYRIGLPFVPGLMSKDAKGNVKGIPLEIFEVIAKDKNIKFVWVDGSWNELFEQVKKGEIDMLPGTQETAARKEILDFTPQSLYTIWSELYIHRSTTFHNILELSNKKIGLVKEDNNALGFLNYIKGFHIFFEPVYFASHSEALLSLKNKKIFAMAGPTPNLLGELPNSIISSGLYFNPVELKYSFPKNKHEELQQKINEQLTQYKETPHSVYYQLIDKYRIERLQQGQWEMPFWVQLLLTLFGVLLVITFLFIFVLRREVSNRTKALKNREAFLRKAIEVGEMGIWQYNIHTQQIFWSDEIYNITKIRRDSDFLTKEKLKKMIHPEDTERVMNFIATISKQETFEEDCRIVNDQNEVVFLKLVGHLLKDNGNEAHTAVGIIRNVSRQKLYEQELIAAKEKAERNEKLKSAFLANMSHEIRTPLNSIIGFSNLIASEEIDDQKKKDYREIILKQNEVLLTLINDIIDLAKIESGSIEIRMSNTDVRSLLENLYLRYQESCPQNIQFKLDLQLKEKDYTICTDRTRLEQIINNLVSNAFKYTPEGQVILGYRYSEKKGYFDIFVKDTGIGISPKDQSMLFLRFSQLNNLKQGAGLGLAISQSLAVILGSRIKLFSEEGKGSEFFLSLPLE